MAEAKEAAKEGAEEAPKKSKKKLFIIIGAVIVLLGGGGAFYFTKIKGGEVAEEGAEHGEVAKKGDGPTINILTFEPFIVNLMEASGNRYLKVVVNIEAEAEVMAEAEAKNAQIRDSIIILLSSKTYSDVGSVQGKYQLRDEIAARTNMALTSGRVKSVYFTEFVIQ